MGYLRHLLQCFDFLLFCSRGHIVLRLKISNFLDINNKKGYTIGFYLHLQLPTLLSRHTNFQKTKCLIFGALYRYTDRGALSL